MDAHPLPPGPQDHFLYGNFPLANSDSLGLLTSWARRYGDLFHYRFLHIHVYFLNRPEYIEDALVTHHRLFIKGRGLRANKALLGNGLLTSEGDFWRRQRRLSQPAFHRERIATYARTMVAYTERMLESWKDGDERDVHREMMRLTLEIVAKVLFSVEVADQVAEVSQAMEAVMRQNTRGRMLFPVLRYLPTPGNLRYQRAVRTLNRIVNGIIGQRRAGAGNGDDLLSMLLQARDEDGSRMTDRQLRDEVMTLILAGHETTALLLSWTWFLLAQHPDVEARLEEELDRVLGDRSPRLEDLPALPYTGKIIKEALRLYPPAYILARIACEDYQIAGYRIPAGSSVVMSQWIVHRDPRYYDEPERFNPDRWSEDFEKRLPRYAYFPFGGGPRLCIGNSFALTEAALILTMVARRFRMRLRPDPPVVPLPAITLRPRYGVPVTLVERSTPHRARDA